MSIRKHRISTSGPRGFAEAHRHYAAQVLPPPGEATPASNTDPELSWELRQPEPPASEA